MKVLFLLTLHSLSLLLLTTLLDLTIQDHRTTMHLIRSEQAYYLAEAGQHHAKRHLAVEPAWRGQSASIPFGPSNMIRMESNLGVDTDHIFTLNFKLSKFITETTNSSDKRTSEGDNQTPINKNGQY